MLRRWIAPHMAVFLLLCCALTLVIGCGGRPSIAPPDFDSTKAANQAMELFDADGDGFIANAELDECPGLKDGLKTVDANEDGKITMEDALIYLRLHSE